jgi:hypothetical protein
MHAACLGWLADRASRIAKKYTRPSGFVDHHVRVQAAIHWGLLQIQPWSVSSAPLRQELQRMFSGLGDALSLYGL